MSFDETYLSYVPFIEPVINQQNGPYRKQRNIFITFTIILLVLLLLSVAILIFIATKKIQPSTSTTLFYNISTTTDSTTIQQTITTTLMSCFPVGWNSVGDIVVYGGYYFSITVDKDFNIYVVNQINRSLEKWSPNGEKVQNYFEGHFLTRSPLFYHSLHQSIYFCYTQNNKAVLFKAPIGNLTSMHLVNITGYGGSTNGDSNCDGLYVSTAGDIFILYVSPRNVFKWIVNSTSGIIMADSYTVTSDNLQSVFPSVLAVGETNSIIYLLDKQSRRVVKYIDGNLTGTTIISQRFPSFFSNEESETFTPWSMLLDKTGNILVSESDKISIWTPDGKFNLILMRQYQNSQDHTMKDIHGAYSMAFDRLGNLYVNFGSNVIRFNRTSSTCKSNS